VKLELYRNPGVKLKKPLLFRGGVGVGTHLKEIASTNAPTLDPSPEGEGGQ
jgi:hypothetical protein